MAPTVSVQDCSTRINYGCYEDSTNILVITVNQMLRIYNLFLLSDTGIDRVNRNYLKQLDKYSSQSEQTHCPSF
ncbi:unnamed protein product, partial [Adineta steineri]